MVNILKLQQRTMQYEFADGIRDFQTAVWLFLMAFYLWFLWGMPETWQPVVDWARSAGDFVLLALIVAFFSLPMLISQGCLSLMNTYVRRRWLWRETGFIKPKAWPVLRSIVLTALGVMGLVSVLGVLAGLQLNSAWWVIRASYIGIAVGMAWMYFRVGGRLDIARYRLVACAGMVGTVIIIMLPLNGPLCGFVVGVYWALVLAFSGAYALLQVVQQPGPNDDAA